MVLFANCHMHSTFSDGAYTPERLVELGAALGHRAMILTDHDTVRGTYFMQRAARRVGILTLLGCEFSTIGPEHSEIHLLGFDFNPDNEKMKKLLERTASKATKRTHYLFDRALERGTMRTGITWDDVLRVYPYNDYICNNQVFEVMKMHGIYEPSEYADFFNASFRSTPALEAEVAEVCNLKNPDVDEVIKTIICAEGVPVVAHLGEAPFGNSKHTDELRRMGARGFEVLHPCHDGKMAEFFNDYCNEYGLYKMGGTDHSCTLGGYLDTMPEHRLPEDCGGISEEDFMKIYRRELG